MMKRSYLILSALLLLSAPSSARPIPGISRVLIISVDGLRPDLSLRANAPVLRSLMVRGSYSLWAQTTAVAVTLPSHVSMFTGVPPSKHGVEWNSVLPTKRIIYPAWPTLFELARKAGYTTAMAAGKSKFQGLTEPSTLTWSFVPKATVISDTEVTDRAIQWIDRFGPQVLFVHLPGVDIAGHTSGWGSQEQLDAIANADNCIGRLLDAYKEKALLDSTFVLVTADHGGAGKSHGPDDPRSRMIPWIVVGPGVRSDYDLTREEDLTVKTEDTFATACYVLGITPPRPVDGHPVLQIFSSPRESHAPIER